jgi:hypothetical protein
LNSSRISWGSGTYFEPLGFPLIYRDCIATSTAASGTDSAAFDGRNEAESGSHINQIIDIATGMPPACRMAVFQTADEPAREAVWDMVARAPAELMPPLQTIKGFLAVVSPAA